MTGFGAASGEEGDVAIRVELRSVNHRHLQVKVRTPAEISNLEPDLDGLVRKKLHRGSVSLAVFLREPPESRAAVVHPEVAERYRGQIEALGEQLGLDGSVDLAQLLTLPGVLTVPDAEVEDRSLKKGVQRVVRYALAALEEMRATEGAALEKDLRKNAVALERIVGRIEKRMPKVVRGHHRTLQKRLSELLDGRAVPEADLARELALIADKADVTEETSRLRSHLEQLDAVLEKGGCVGRQLDFLVQELFREVNTIGSKCSDADVAHWVVDAKTRVERLREQVQNVE